jgi:sporulation integral membrane protein YlbJ
MNAKAKPQNRQRILRWVKDLLLLAAILLIVRFPSPAYRAALRGMELFLFTVAPGLIPFLILCPLFLRTRLFHIVADGFSHMSVRLFRCGGACGPLFLMGCLSGYPAGARFVRDALSAGQITEADSIRALCFCNVCGPLFMLGAVGVGMFGHAACGWVLAASHYTAALITGIIMACVPIRGISAGQICTPVKTVSKQNRSFLSALGLSVQNAMQTMLLVGGYIILGSVAAALLDTCGIWGALYRLIGPVISPVGVTPELFTGTASGIIEISGGCARITGTVSPLWVRLGLCALVIGFSGFAIIGQTTALWESRTFPLWRYLGARLIHAFTAASLTVAAALLLPLDRLAQEASTSPPPVKAALQADDGIAYILMGLLLTGYLYAAHKNKKAP